MPAAEPEPEPGEPSGYDAHMASRHYMAGHKSKTARIHAGGGDAPQEGGPEEEEELEGHRLTGELEKLCRNSMPVRPCTRSPAPGSRA